MTVVIGDALRDGAARLRAAGIESARLDARVLMAFALQVSSEAVFAAEELSSRASERFDALIARRAAREPLAYITGQREFWSLPFAVGPGVLVPRPETETLLQAGFRRFPGGRRLRVLDIGTGSGCLLISFLQERPETIGVGIDISEEALAWARQNADQLGVSARCRLQRAEDEPEGEELFDVILVNPPYLTAAEFEASAPEIRLWEPRFALVGGEDGLAVIRALARTLARRLSRDGEGFVEVGIGQAAAAAEILAGSGLDVREVIPDLSVIPRCLVVGRAGSGARRPRKKSVGNAPSTG